jgi:hypothetical protein
MTTGNFKTTNYERLEYQRALAIVEKAQRNELNVVETLVSHMVSTKLIEEVTGSLPSWERNVKTNRLDQIRGLVEERVGDTFKTAEIAELLGVSAGTAIKLIKDYMDFFSPAGRGLYLIKNGEAERAEQKAAKRLDK